MRKAISVQEGLFSSGSSYKARQRSKIMNEILYLMRKLTKLARRAQAISEGSEDDDLDKELQEIREEIKSIESKLEESPL